MQAGEAALQTPIAPLPLSLWLDFTHTGRRTPWETAYFSRRARLCALVSAECVEHEGRFLDAIADTVWALCEESAWQLPAHNSYIRDTPQLPLPDTTRPIVDLFAAETGALLCCEEGETEYDPKVLFNVFTYTVDDPAQLTPEFFKKLEKQYRPKQVIIEFNGMWSFEPLYREGLPTNWILYQIMCLVDATTFEPYLRNMGQLMMEKILNADMIIFNRCNEELRKALPSAPSLMVRGVLYTALTRARELLVIVGDDAAIRSMAANDRQQKRYSGLKWRLCHAGDASE